jgi:hypothetical protein
MTDTTYSTPVGKVAGFRVRCEWSQYAGHVGIVNDLDPADGGVRVVGPAFGDLGAWFRPEELVALSEVPRERRCLTCAYADRNGSWPTDHHGTHCRTCHRSWVSRAQVHCVLCHENFATHGVADLHWPRAGHVHPSEVPKLDRHDEANGPVWRTAQIGTITPSSDFFRRSRALERVS